MSHKNNESKEFKQKNHFKLILIILIIIVFLSIGFLTNKSSDSNSMFLYQSSDLSGEAFKARGITRVAPCSDTDSKALNEIYQHGTISFIEKVNKISDKTIKKIETDVCKDHRFLLEWSCANYNSKNNLDVSSKLMKAVDCKHGCNKQKSACNLYPTCDNKIKDGDETDIDCGGGKCKLCPSQQFCEDSDALNFENKGFITVEVDVNGQKQKQPIDDYCKKDAQGNPTNI